MSHVIFSQTDLRPRAKHLPVTTEPGWIGISSLQGKTLPTQLIAWTERITAGTIFSEAL